MEEISSLRRSRVLAADRRRRCCRSAALVRVRRMIAGTDCRRGSHGTRREVYHRTRNRWASPPRPGCARGDSARTGVGTVRRCATVQRNGRSAAVLDGAWRTPPCKSAAERSGRGRQVSVADQGDAGGPCNWSANDGENGKGPRLLAPGLLRMAAPQVQ